LAGSGHSNRRRRGRGVGRHAVILPPPALQHDGTDGECSFGGPLTDFATQAASAVRAAPNAIGRFPAAIDQLVNRCMDPIREGVPAIATNSSTCSAVTIAARRVQSMLALSASAPNRARGRTGGQRCGTVGCLRAISPEDAKPVARATILDISCDGIRLLTPRPIAVKSVVHITVGEQVNSLALVRWTRPGEDQMQIVGRSFVRPLLRHELDAMAVKPDHANAGHANAMIERRFPQGEID
jgi:hypothetical protein